MFVDRVPSALVVPDFCHALFYGSYVNAERRIVVDMIQSELRCICSIWNDCLGDSLHAIAQKVILSFRVVVSLLEREDASDSGHTAEREPSTACERLSVMLGPADTSVAGSNAYNTLA